MGFFLVYSHCFHFPPDLKILCCQFVSLPLPLLQQLSKENVILWSVSAVVTTGFISSPGMLEK